MSLGNWLLAHVLTALLPPPSDGDDEYYAVLGVERGADAGAIRQAYRAKSLQYHPDKIAQRGGNAEEARVAYEKIQTAYACLHDDKKRRTYQQLGNDPARYRFVADGGWYHPAALYDNLSRASIGDKTRLVVLCSLALVLLLLQPILIAAKVNGAVGNSTALQTASWVSILTPLWIGHGLVLAFWWVLLVITAQSDGFQTARVWVLALTFGEQVCWLAGEIVLARQWDAPTLNWFDASTPFYLALLMRVAGSNLALIGIKEEQAKMVSPGKMQQLVEAEARDDEQLEDVLERLQTEYTVVDVDDDAVAAALAMAEDTVNLSDDELEELRVHSSPEYQAAAELVQTILVRIGTILVLAIPLVALISAKLEGQISGNWWTVFVPVWLALGWTILSSMFVCCCVSAGESVLVVGGESDDEHEHNEEAGQAAVDQVKASTNFAAPEGDMKEFNHIADNDAKVEHTPSDEKASDGGDKDEEEDPPAGESGVANDDESKTSIPFDEVSATEPVEALVDVPLTEGTAEEPQDAIETNKPDPEGEIANGGQQEEEEDHESEGAIPFIDAETFHAWQQAQAEAEHSAMERQAKAQSSCCWATFQLIIVCLIVGKLEADYDNTSGAPGYNAFWILFPVFFIAGLLLCCCSCLIYGAGAAGLDDLVERAKQQKEGEGEDEPDTPTSDGEPIVMAPPPPGTTEVQPVAVPIATRKADEVPAEAEPDLEEGRNMEDLD